MPKQLTLNFDTVEATPPALEEYSKTCLFCNGKKKSTVKRYCSTQCANDAVDFITTCLPKIQVNGLMKMSTIERINSLLEKSKQEGVSLAVMFRHMMFRGTQMGYQPADIVVTPKLGRVIEEKGEIPSFILDADNN